MLTEYVNRNSLCLVVMKFYNVWKVKGNLWEQAGEQDLHVYLQEM